MSANVYNNKIDEDDGYNNISRSPLKELSASSKLLNNNNSSNIKASTDRISM